MPAATPARLGAALLSAWRREWRVEQDENKLCTLYSCSILLFVYLQKTSEYNNFVRTRSQARDSLCKPAILILIFCCIFMFVFTNRKLPSSFSFIQIVISYSHSTNIINMLFFIFILLNSCSPLILFSNLSTFCVSHPRQPGSLLSPRGRDERLCWIAAS